MYRQGQLDGLCGVYAVINSVKAMADWRKIRLSRAEAKQLFSVICDALAGSDKLSDALIDGTTLKTFREMVRFGHIWLNSTKNLRLTDRRAFNSLSVDLAGYWRCLQDHEAGYGPGSILIGMSHRHEHWTCLRSISDQRISLVDSDGIKLLRRSRCTVGTPNYLRHHWLVPTQTLLMSD